MSPPDLPTLLEPAEAVLKFLASVGSNAEAEFYLRLFRSRAKESFAAVAVEAEALAHDLDGVAMDLRFLSALDLTPVVMLGLDLPEGAAAQRQRLAALLREAEVAHAGFDTPADAPAIAAAAARGAIPLVCALAPEREERLRGLASLLSALATHKLIFVGPQGGLGLRGERLEVVNLSTDYEALRASLALEQRQRELLEDCRRLVLELCRHRLLCAIASPLNLLQELFTVKGAGTLLRAGARIQRHDGLAGVELERLRGLLAASFGKPVKDALFGQPLRHVYLEEGYRGAALVLDTPLGGYLSKFAVTREAQGEGIGQDLWSAVVTDHPRLLWRARRENPIRAWYERKCQARFDAEPFTVYARGIPPAELPAAIEFALAQPLDFEA